MAKQITPAIKIDINGPDRIYKAKFIASGAWETIKKGQICTVELDNYLITFTGEGGLGTPRMIKSDTTNQVYWETIDSKVSIALFEFITQKVKGTIYDNQSIS